MSTRVLLSFVIVGGSLVTSLFAKWSLLELLLNIAYTDETMFSDYIALDRWIPLTWQGKVSVIIL